MDERINETVLLSVRVHSHDGLELLKKTLQVLKNKMKFVALSSVYRTKVQDELAQHVHDLRTRAQFEGFVVAIRAFTEDAPLELLQVIQSIEATTSNESMRQSVTIELYFYGSRTQMTPEMTLPEPSFHLHAEKVLPMAEIAADFIHPVLKQSIRELARPYISRSWGEFVAQGKAMLDF